MKKYFSIIISALLILSSCTSSKRHNYILHIDNSRTISESVLNKYISIIQKSILLNMSRYDRMTIQFIDECSMSKAERIFSLDLASIQFSNKADGINNAADFTKARMKKFLEDSIQPNLKTIILSKRAERHDCGYYTDIINALNEASSLITHERSYTSKIDKILNDALGHENYEFENCIIIFSDMVNENREKTFDFTEFGKYNEEKIQNKLEELRRLNKIPDLEGCKILIYGATSTIGAGIYANKQIENCKTFWQSYFFQTGAKLIGYGYDSRKEIADYMTYRN